jgi:lactate dehydrogenase-like 2-hydroxyacid dehydrogenase
VTGQADQVLVAIAGRFNERAIERVTAHFRTIMFERADPTLIPPELAAQVRGLAALCPVDGAFLDGFPNLEIVAGGGVGYDTIDVARCVERGIVITNTPDVLTDEVADATIGLLINTVRELPQAEAFLRSGRWAAGERFPLTRATLRERHIGIYGMGRIGLGVARRLEAFGLRISYHNRRPVEGVSYGYQPSLKALAEAVDTLVCVAPGGAATQHAINADILRALGPDGVLINVGRGSTVDEAALIEALRDGTILAAGLDVFDNEPHVPQALIDLPNACLVPHIASATVHTRRAMGDLTFGNLEAWFREGRALTPVAETSGIVRK